MTLPQDNWVLVMPLRRQMCSHGGEHRAPCQTCGAPAAGHGQDTGDFRDSSASFAPPAPLQLSYLHLWDAFPHPFPTDGVQGGGFLLPPAQLPQGLSVLLPPLLSPHIGGEKLFSPCVLSPFSWLCFPCSIQCLLIYLPSLVIGTHTVFLVPCTYCRQVFLPSFIGKIYKKTAFILQINVVNAKN